MKTPIEYDFKDNRRLRLLVAMASTSPSKRRRLKQVREYKVNMREVDKSFEMFDLREWLEGLYEDIESPLVRDFVRVHDRKLTHLAVLMWNKTDGKIMEVI